MVVSAGVGFFRASASLSKFTKRRSFDHGVGLDLVCLPPPPLHSVPVFEVRSGRSSNRQEFRYPHWLLVYFYVEGSSKATKMITESDEMIQSEAEAVRTSADIHHASVNEKSSQYVPSVTFSPSNRKISLNEPWPVTPCPSEAVELDVSYEKMKADVHRHPPTQTSWLDRW